MQVEFPEDQTCCGQPAFNTGYWDEARPCAEHFVRVFKNAEVVVCPSGSCVTMIRTFYPELLAHSSLREDAIALASRTFELSEFLVKVAAVTQVGANFSAHGHLSRVLPRAPRTSHSRRTFAALAPGGRAEAD
jgi:L-lactate dehydrogenase complex protein LldE